MTGKGDKWRKGTNYDKYYNSPFWEARTRTYQEPADKVAKYVHLDVDETGETTVNTKTYLFLDDWRHPVKAYLWDDGIPLVNKVNVPGSRWNIVKTYDEFVEFVEKNGIPDVVSFDNDLFNVFDPDLDEDDMRRILTMKDWETYPIKCGAHCAQWLVEKCREQKRALPEYYIHSANTVARGIIRSILENARYELENLQLQN